MALDFYIFDVPGQDPVERYEVGDIVDITDATGPLPFPNTSSPFRIVRVATSLTKPEVMHYLDKKTSGQQRRRLYYLDTTRMSVADLATWTSNRSISTDQQTAMSWIRSK